MRIAIESTDMFTAIDGAPARVWAGVTEGGVKCHVFVCRVAVAQRADTAEFDRELREQLPPAEFAALAEVLKG